MQRMWEIYFDWKYVLEINYGIKNDICIFYILFIMQEADFRSSLSTCNLYQWGISGECCCKITEQQSRCNPAKSFITLEAEFPQLIFAESVLGSSSASLKMEQLGSVQDKPCTNMNEFLPRDVSTMAT